MCIFSGTHKTWTPNMDPQSGPPNGPQYGPPSKTTKFGLDRQPFPNIVGKVGKACNWLIRRLNFDLTLPGNKVDGCRWNSLRIECY